MDGDADPQAPTLSPTRRRNRFISCFTCVPFFLFFSRSNYRKKMGTHDGQMSNEDPLNFAGSDDVPTDVPRLGLRFPSIEDAYEFWRFYALRTGFGTINRTTHKRNGIVYSATFICTRGNKPRGYNGPPSLDIITQANEDAFKVRKHGNHWTNCHARMIIMDFIADGNWEINNVDLAHNHKLAPKSVRYFVVINQQDTIQLIHHHLKYNTDISTLLKCKLQKNQTYHH